MGSRAFPDRFDDYLAFLEPRMRDVQIVVGCDDVERLQAVDGVDRRTEVASLREQLSSLRTVVHVPYDGGEEDVDRDSARQKKNVVFAAVVPDPLRGVAKQPTEPGREPALRH